VLAFLFIGAVGLMMLCCCLCGVNLRLIILTTGFEMQGCLVSASYVEQAFFLTHTLCSVVFGVCVSVGIIMNVGIGVGARVFLTFCWCVEVSRCCTHVLSDLFSFCKAFVTSRFLAVKCEFIL